MVERRSKLTKLKKVSRKTARKVANAGVDSLGEVKEFVATLTADNGKEFAYHKRVSTSLNTQLYVATPYHSWERGLHEHTHGLVQTLFP